MNIQSVQIISTIITFQLMDKDAVIMSFGIYISSGDQAHNKQVEIVIRIELEY